MKLKYLLQIGLATTLLFAGIDSIFHPYDWIGYIPAWVNDLGISSELALRLHSALEIVLGSALLTGWQTRIVSLFVALDILVILLLNGFNRSIFLVTFRDISLFFTALYLFLHKEVIE